MDNLIEKWNNDQKFKAAIQLTLYTLFAMFAIILALSNKVEPKLEEKQEEPKTEESITQIQITDEYNYHITITKNEDTIEYIGNKNNNTEEIKKIANNKEEHYKYENQKYYKKENDMYVLTTKEDIYDLIDYSYLDLNKVNQYLLNSQKIDGINYVYLKDIILNSESEEYITISINSSEINIDYTNLIKQVDEEIANCIVKIVLEK